MRNFGPAGTTPGSPAFQQVIFPGLEIVGKTALFSIGIHHTEIHEFFSFCRFPVSLQLFFHCRIHRSLLQSRIQRPHQPFGLFCCHFAGTSQNIRQHFQAYHRRRIGFHKLFLQYPDPVVYFPLSAGNLQSLSGVFRLKYSGIGILSVFHHIIAVQLIILLLQGLDVPVVSIEQILGNRTCNCGIVIFQGIPGTGQTDVCIFHPNLLRFRITFSGIPAFDFQGTKAGIIHLSRQHKTTA